MNTRRSLCTPGRCHKWHVTLPGVWLWMALTACNSAQTGRTVIDPALTAFVSPDATMLAGVRMEAVRATPLYQKIMAKQAMPQLDEFVRQTGFDPRRDVRDLLVVSNGKDVLVAARGNFSPHAFESLSKSSYKGYTLYTRDSGGLALVNSSTVIAGTLPAVRSALDRHKAGQRRAPPELLDRGRQIPPQNQIWSVSSGFENLLAARIPETGNAANAGRILRSLENTTAAADLRNGVNGFITGLCRTEQDAKNLGDTARGLVGLGRLSVPDTQPEMLRVWDGIKVDQRERTINITVAIPQALVDKLVDMLRTSPGLEHLSRPVALPRPAASWEPELRRPI